MRHTVPQRIALFLAAAFLSSCHASPVAPTPAASTTALGSAAGSGPATGRAVDALDGTPVVSAAVSVDGVTSLTGADGSFQVTVPETGSCRLSVSAPTVVPRETEFRMSGGGATLSLISSQFDMATFNQMARDGGFLRRWTTPPALVIVDAVLQFGSVSDSTFTALGERLTAEERASMVADLSWALPQVTGGSFQAFASVTVESPAPGTSVQFFSREGRIVVARFRGLTQATGYWGYGRSARRDSTVVAGAILLDRDFDAAPGPYTRSLRVHELGHALGYCHVTTRSSFMNSAATLEPNDFDKDASRIVFQRPPGNQAPDRDPQPTLSIVVGGLVWHTIVP